MSTEGKIGRADVGRTTVGKGVDHVGGVLNILEDYRIELMWKWVRVS